MTKNRRANHLAAAKVEIAGGADGPPLPKQPRRPTCQNRPESGEAARAIIR
jgi:hypothetical protein